MQIKFCEYKKTIIDFYLIENTVSKFNQEINCRFPIDIL